MDDGGGNINHKATGLKVVCKKLGLAHSDVLAIGNDTNDIEMFEWAGYSVVSIAKIITNNVRAHLLCL